MTPTPSRSAQLRALLQSTKPEFLLEAHNAVSAQIVAEAGFAGIWASSLTLSTAFGYRDNNELSMTQVLDLLETMTERVSIPILFDGDTGYGTFNHFQRLVQRLTQRRVAGVCIEDKLFPKTNSFLSSEKQELAPVEEFCGKIRAGKDAQTDSDFVIVARTEALIAGLGMDEALERAACYAEAGADAILVHSKAPTVAEISEFSARWNRPTPIICVPTTYYGTPPEIFAQSRISIVIWANQMMRSAVHAMKKTAAEIAAASSARSVEDRIAPVSELFRLQDAAALEAAERVYATPRGPSAVILAASRGADLGTLTEDRPKCMIRVGGEPIIDKLVRDFRAEGVRDLSIVRGYAKEKLAPEGVRLVDNDEWHGTGELYSLARAKAADAITDNCIIAYGDLILKRYILHELLCSKAPLTIVVDVSKRFRSGHEVDKVQLRGEIPAPYEESRCTLRNISMSLTDGEADGEWIGLLYARGPGSVAVKRAIDELMATPRGQKAWMGDLLNQLIASDDIPISVLHVRGDWIDVDTVADLADDRLA